jgi:hypothetical protein
MQCCGRIPTSRRTLLPQSWGWIGRLKRWYPTATLHSITIQKTSTWATNITDQGLWFALERSCNCSLSIQLLRCLPKTHIPLDVGVHIYPEPINLSQFQ